MQIVTREVPLHVQHSPPSSTVAFWPAALLCVHQISQVSWSSGQPPPPPPAPLIPQPPGQAARRADWPSWKRWGPTSLFRTCLTLASITPYRASRISPSCDGRWWRRPCCPGYPLLYVAGNPTKLTNKYQSMLPHSLLSPVPFPSFYHDSRVKSLHGKSSVGDRRLRSNRFGWHIHTFYSDGRPHFKPATLEYKDHSLPLQWITIGL